jgi:hypothetical protein
MFPAFRSLDRRTSPPLPRWRTDRSARQRRAGRRRGLRRGVLSLQAPGGRRRDGEYLGMNALSVTIQLELVPTLRDAPGTEFFGCAAPPSTDRELLVAESRSRGLKRNTPGCAHLW